MRIGWHVRLMMLSRVFPASWRYHQDEKHGILGSGPELVLSHLITAKKLVKQRGARTCVCPSNTRLPFNRQPMKSLSM